MSNEITRKVVIRKVTFTTKNKDGSRYFKPANKRAQKYGKLFTGRRTGLLTLEQVMTCVSNNHRPFRYNGKGKLVRITF